jgi:hypothetical protein
MNSIIAVLPGGTGTVCRLWSGGSVRSPYSHVSSNIDPIMWNAE